MPDGIIKTLGSLSFLLPISSQCSLFLEANRKPKGRRLSDVAHASQPPKTDSSAEKAGNSYREADRRLLAKTLNVHKHIYALMSFFNTNSFLLAVFLFSFIVVSFLFVYLNYVINCMHI